MSAQARSGLNSSPSCSQGGVASCSVVAYPWGSWVWVSCSGWLLGGGLRHHAPPSLVRMFFGIAKGGAHLMVWRPPLCGLARREWKEAYR